MFTITYVTYSNAFITETFKTLGDACSRYAALIKLPEIMGVGAPEPVLQSN